MNIMQLNTEQTIKCLKECVFSVKNKCCQRQALLCSQLYCYQQLNSQKPREQQSQATSLIWSAHTVSLACCDHPHRSFCQFHLTIWTLLLVISLLLLRDFKTLFHWTVELLHPLTHSRSVLRHFSLIWHNCTVARASVLWRDINWLIDWLIDWLGYKNTQKKPKPKPMPVSTGSTSFVAIFLSSRCGSETAA